MCTHQPLLTTNSNATIARSSHLCRIFTRQLGSFYRLAFLLTGDHAKAEQCTLASLEEALSAEEIDLSCAESRSKRAVIKAALRMMGDEPVQIDSAPDHSDELKDEFPCWPFTAILGLTVRERFAFVITVLERISDRECSGLLGRAVSEITAARIRAFEFLSTLEIERTSTKCLENSL